MEFRIRPVKDGHSIEVFERPGFERPAPKRRGRQKDGVDLSKANYYDRAFTEYQKLKKAGVQGKRRS